MTATATAASPLHSEMDLLEADVKIGAGRDVEVTIIKAGMGNPSHRHFYGADVLREAAGKFAGAHMYSNHEIDPAAQRKRGGVRDVKDLVGVIRESWWDETAQAVKGRATILRDWVMEILRVDPTVLEVSINGSGRTKPGRVSGAPAMMVEAIQKVKSVDIVSRGGARGRFNRILESLQEDAEMALESITLDDLKEHRPDLLDAHASQLAEAAGSDDGDQISKADHEAALTEAAEAAAAEAKETLQAEHALELQKRDNAVIVRDMLEAEDVRKTLPKKSRDDIARRFADVTFTETKDEDDEVVTPEAQLRESLQTAIKEKQEELAEARGDGEITGMGGGSDLSEGGATATKNMPKHAAVLAMVAPDSDE